MNIMVGSIESSDLLLEFTDQNQGVYISNLVPEIDNELIEQVVISFLKEFNLVRFNPKVYYNGANQWVIKGRCEAAALLVAAATAIKEEEGGDYTMRKKISQITDNERVIFYVAGYKPGYIEKAMTLGLKNIILCLEDGTPENKKIEARSLVKRALSEFKDLDLNLIVRINSVYTDHWKADFEALLENRPTRIRIPMVNKAEDLLEIDEYWRFISKESDDDYKPLYEIMIESKEGLNNLERIYQCSDNIYAFTLGGGDYYDDVKLNSDDPQKEVLFAKQKICQFCNENSLYSFDTTFMKYKDLEGYRNDCEFSRNLGFTGRSIIHPDQIKIGLEVYSERKGTYV